MRKVNAEMMKCLKTGKTHRNVLSIGEIKQTNIYVLPEVGREAKKFTKVKVALLQYVVFIKSKCSQLKNVLR